MGKGSGNCNSRTSLNHFESDDNNFQFELKRAISYKYNLNNVDSSEILKDNISRLPLSEYANNYGGKTLVQQNLPKKILPLDIFNQVYLEQGRFLDFEEFYDFYYKNYKKDVNEFVDKYINKQAGDIYQTASKNGKALLKELFFSNFKSRVYRTWLSLLTELHAAKLVQEINKSNIEFSVEDDLNGVDFVDSDNKLKFQIKKDSYQFIHKQNKDKKIISPQPYKALNSEEFEKLKNNSLPPYLQERVKEIKQYGEILDNGITLYKKVYFRKLLKEYK